MKPTVISLAAGPMQVPLIETIENSGRICLAVDRDSAAEGFRYATARAVASTHDPDQVLAAVEPLLEQYRPVAVMTKSSGMPVLSAARVAERMGLRGLNPARLADLASKDRLLDLAESVGVPVPERVVLDGGELVPPPLPFPFVLKPCVTLVGKQGIERVARADDWPCAILAARQASGDGRVQAEEFLPGRDVIWAGLFRPGAVWRAGLLEEQVRFEPDRRVNSRGFSMPARVGQEQARHLDRLAERLLEGAELGYGSALLAFRVGEDPAPGETGPRVTLIEAHFDLAGEGVTDRLIPAATGIDFQAAALELLAGGELPEVEAAERPSALRLVNQHGSCSELAFRLRLPGVTGLRLKAGPQRVEGTVLVTGRDADQLDRHLGRVDRALARPEAAHAA